MGAFSERRRQMSNMKSFGIFLLATACLLVSSDIATARAVRPWSYQELLEASDVVAIATPTASNDTMEHIDLPGFAGQRVIGIETRFAVSAVLKGEKTLKDLVLHHYRPRPAGIMVPNGPSFIYFADFRETVSFPKNIHSLSSSGS